MMYFEMENIRVLKVDANLRLDTASDVGVKCGVINFADLHVWLNPVNNGNNNE